jgi:hypothetical protein
MQIFISESVFQRTGPETSLYIYSQCDSQSYLAQIPSMIPISSAEKDKSLAIAPVSLYHFDLTSCSPWTALASLLGL